MKRVMTQNQTQILRRILHIVGQELVQMANSPKLPDQWGELGPSTYTLEALEGVYQQLEADKLIPKRS